MARKVQATILVTLLALLCSLVCGSTARAPHYLTLYAHESRVPPSNTLVVSASPSGNTTGLDEFGLIRTVSNVLHSGRSNTSTIIGSQVGIVVIGKDGANVYISYTYFLNANATCKGTIAVHGHIDGTSTVDRVFPVVGGTGEFLSVRGSDKSAFDSPIQADPANVINVHYLTLYFP